MRDDHDAPADRLAGFTLIEVMLALAIFGFVTTIMLGSFTQTATSKRAIESAQERTHTVRVALMRMTREIEMAYLSSSENMALTNRRTLLIGTTRADVDELLFSSFAHQRLRAGAAESDTSVVSYYGERDPDDRRVTQPDAPRDATAAGRGPEPADRRVVRPVPGRQPREVLLLRPQAEGVDQRLEHDERLGQQYLPTHIRIILTVFDERGQEVSYTTDARIQMTEKVGYRPLPS